MKKILLAITLLIILIYLFSILNNMGSVTGQVKMNKDIIAGRKGEFVLKKDSIVEVSKEYFLPQILLPGTIGGMKRFDTPPPLYTQIGTGVYFSGKNATEIIPFKGKPRGGMLNAISTSLSLGYGANQLIVYGFIIILITLIIFITNKSSKNNT